MADGFGCRTQIQHGTHRRALHLAEVLKMAIEPRLSAGSSALPEQQIAARREHAVVHSISTARVATRAVLIGLAGLAAPWAGRKRA